MKKLSNAEEQLMEYLWQKQTAYMKDLLEAYPDPKPASTTIATLLKRMINKKMVGYHQRGNSREYYPKISKNAYFSRKMKTIISDYFGNSAFQFASFFAKEISMTPEQWEELKKIVDSNLKKE